MHSKPFTGRHGRGRTVLAAGALLGGLVVPAGVQAHPAAAPEIMKVLSYNVAGVNIPFVDWNEDHFGNLDISDRGAMIAGFIKSGGYDVVAIQEGWVNPPTADTIVDDLVDHLKSPGGPYTYVVQGLGSQTTPKLDSSGLMLFSKLPFIARAVPPGRICYTGTSATCFVAFHMFETAIGEDMVTAKGIGWVKVRSPATGRPTNIFFTHMQADPESCLVGLPCDPRAARAAQFQEAIAFINAWAPQATSGEDTLLVGDLNVPFRKADGSVHPEYSVRTADLASIGLTDAWTTQAQTDLMPSWVQGIKYDYMFYRPAPPSALTAVIPACFQHQTLERQFHIEAAGDQGYTGPASDHYGYAAVMAADAARCSPVKALTNPIDGLHSLALGHPGSYQWVRFSTPGTYGFDVIDTPQPMELTAFAEDDLSTPLAPLEGVSVVPGNGEREDPEDVIFAERKPFYLRIRATSPTFTGSYKLFINHHGGGSFTDAIQLDPYVPYNAIEMSQLVANPLTTEYFRFRTHTLSSGAKQFFDFLTTLHPNLSLKMRIYDKAKVDGNLPDSLLAETANHNTGAFVWSIPPSGSSPIPAAGSDYFLVVEKLPNINAPGPYGTFTVEWRTNLFKVELLDLKVIEDDDSSPNDEPEVTITPDGASSVHAILGEVSEGNSNGFPQGKKSFTATLDVALHVRENDDDDGDICIVPGADCTDFGTGYIDTSDVFFEPGPAGMHFYSQVDPTNGHWLIRFMAWRRVHN